ncbi:MAG: type II toxin-antitoxin system VapC family toxin [Jiangellaceae bacterium]|nr:type II toxin-antitoxin system VapC family toxin [Jiangellaceae bacterium]
MPQVVDTSALVDLVVGSPRGIRVGQALTDEAIFVPELLDVEVASALVRLERAGEIDASTANRAHQRSCAFPAERLSHALLRDAAWRLRSSLRIADAFYVACAELVSGTLVTTDARLARAPLPAITVSVVH